MEKEIDCICNNLRSCHETKSEFIKEIEVGKLSVTIQLTKCKGKYYVEYDGVFTDTDEPEFATACSNEIERCPVCGKFLND